MGPQIHNIHDIIMAESAWGSKVPGKPAGLPCLGTFDPHADSAIINW